MGVFGGRRELLCPGGVWTTLVDDAFVQMPREYRLTIASQGGPIDGTLEEKKSRWIFPGSPVAMPLAPSMVVYRGWWSTFFRVRIRPTHDVTVIID